MKKNKNNSYILAFYHSGLFLPFIVFSVISFINNAIFFQKNFIDYNWRYFLAFFGGLSHDLFIFSFIALILAFICEYLPKIFAPFFITAKDGGMQASDRMSASRKGGSLPKADRGIFKLLTLVILHILICLPIFDYLYYKATLERFNWIVLNFINNYSAKGYIENMGNGFIFLVIFIIFLIISIYLSNKKNKLSGLYFFKLLGAICIFTFFASFFTNNIGYSLNTVKNDNGYFWNWDLSIAGGKNIYLKYMYSGSLVYFLPQKQMITKKTKFIPYTDKEKAFLETYGIIPTCEECDYDVSSANTLLRGSERANAIHNDSYHNPPRFNKAIMIILESFPLDYIHAINPNIPPEASPFFDYLINNYPHSKKYYTSDYPTLYGLNSLFSSTIPFNENNQNKQKYNIASLFEEKYSNSTWFISGQSNYYGIERLIFKNIFGFSHFVGYEDLNKLYKEPNGSSWGVDDEILYNYALNRLLEIKNKNYFFVIKLINQHFPIFSYVINKKDQPQNIKQHPYDIVKIIYDADKLLKDFIEKCERNNIIDEKTLVVITADHYPPIGFTDTKLIKSNIRFQLDKIIFFFYSKQKDIFKKLDSEKLCCQLDVAPTLCYLLGLDCPKEYMGQNLLSPNFKPRSIGVLNNKTIYFQSENLSFSESLSKPATSTPVIRKWINNLQSN